MVCQTEFSSTKLVLLPHHEHSMVSGANRRRELWFCHMQTAWALNIHKKHCKMSFFYLIARWQADSGHLPRSLSYTPGSQSRPPNHYEQRCKHLLVTVLHAQELSCVRTAVATANMLSISYCGQALARLATFDGWWGLVVQPCTPT